jgi:uncharacterized membrane protein HdeD (DUF308 family)
MEASAAIVKPAHWWALALIGLLEVVAGFLALVYPDLTLLALGLIFGIYLLIAGTVLIMLGAADELASSGIKTLRIVVGVLTVIAGLLCIVRPGASVLVLLLALSFWFVLTGVTYLTEAAMESRHRVLNVILGLLGIAAGVIVLGNPDVGLITLANLAGIILIIRGVLEVSAGFYMKSHT